MKKADLLKRIEELEKRVVALEVQRIMPPPCPAPASDPVRWPYPGYGPSVTCEAPRFSCDSGTGSFVVRSDQ